MRCAGAKVEYCKACMDGGPGITLSLGEIRLRRAGDDEWIEDAWVSMTATEAEDLAADLIEAARKLRARNR
jgi:siroheme synthase (precorrin-2 oxidase/ferrochelatase)